MTKGFAMEAAAVAEAISFPLDKWGGHCYQVVAAFLESDVLEGAAPATGYYHDADGQNVTDHAWLKLPDGRICDPTRFWFEDRQPYIYIGPADSCYDEKGVRWARELHNIRKIFIPKTPDLLTAFNLMEDRLGKNNA